MIDGFSEVVSFVNRASLAKGRGFARWGTTVKIADHEMREVNQAPRSRRQDAFGNWPQLQRKRLDDCEVECLMESGVEERLF
jgi:hypothetical protein